MIGFLPGRSSKIKAWRLENQNPENPKSRPGACKIEPGALKTPFV